LQDIFNGEYKGKVVFLTGHTGFKGAWMTLWLRLLGAEVVGYSLEPPTQPNLFDATQISNGICHIISDIRDSSSLVAAMQKHKPHFVFHMAAQSLVRRSYKIPRETYETNVMGTVNVLEDVKATPSVKVCIFVSSDKCYENKEWIYAYRENDPMGGYDPYSSSKGAAEIITDSYRRSFFDHPADGKDVTKVVSARAGNVLGGGDWAEDRIIPDCIRSLSKNKPIELRDPYAIRPWQFVLEPLSGYLWLGALLSEGRVNAEYAWNFGPALSNSLCVNDVVERIIKAWGNGRKDYVQNSKEKNQCHEANTLKLDCSKAANFLGWKANLEEDEAIDAAVKWYFEYYNNKNFDAKKFSISQIENYVETAKNKEIVWSHAGESRS